MNNIQIAKETIGITEKKSYTVNGSVVKLPEMDFSNVKVYSPETGNAMISEAAFENDLSLKTVMTDGKLCRITITTEDSYQASSRYENCMVMNFANAHNPGGGFIMGATAQEEALCRCSTLYKSINSSKASEMYKYNNTHASSVESDYMLYSDVCVFRNNKCELLTTPFVTGVVTVPAPNRIGAAMLASEKLVGETMKRRIRILSMVAYQNGRRNLVLGAWGCGAFHNKPQNVSKYFREVLVDEGYGKLFDEVCFAIYGSENGKNITAFKECFEGIYV